MSQHVIVEPLRGPAGLLALDTAAGTATPVDPAAPAVKQGNATRVSGHTFALYADGGMLWFQWDTRRWPFLADDLAVRYAHDLVARTTTFAVGDQSVTYPAWWRDDPLFDPLIPERDEEEDDLGYYAALRREPERLRRLLARWSRTP